MEDSMKDLQNFRAVVTGASSGIGEAYACALAERGADLVLAARRFDRLENLARKLMSENGVYVECLKVDLSEKEGASELYRFAVRGNRKVHLLINNAGVGVFGPFLSRDWSLHECAISVNMRALSELSYRFSKHMLEHTEPSYISNIASISAFQPTGNYAVYSGTKHYIRAFSEVLAFELRGSNVHVQCVCPGGTLTEFMESNGQTLTTSAQAFMMKPEGVARIGLDTLFRKRGLIVVGFLNQIACFLPRVFPRSWAIWLGTSILERSGKPGQLPLQETPMKKSNNEIKKQINEKAEKKDKTEKTEKTEKGE
jgi:uncharacterized protein